MNHELNKLLLQQREEEHFHISLETEFQFYRCISQGDLSILDGEMMTDPTEGLGLLSLDPLRNKKYHLIILIAMITRFCIEGGLPQEEGYTMSDYYIRQVDQTMDSRSLSLLKQEVITEFTKTMHNLKRRRPASLPVIQAMDYIDQHLTTPLTVREIADAVSCHPDYLSRLFKKETGVSLSRFLLEQKCHCACYMLENSTATCTDIATFLGFSSCSHFIKRFRQIEGMTPEEYRHSKIRNAFNGYHETP
ncbi:MAG: AraC family transcriptional regulator [Lachnospiraceae bacterium]|nr:AraC family transcriptional regulator [Lachnospiraceae bacterium]